MTLAQMQKQGKRQMKFQVRGGLMGTNRVLITKHLTLTAIIQRKNNNNEFQLDYIRFAI